MLLDLAYLFVVLLNTSISFLQHCIIRSTDRRGEPTACMGHALLAFDGLLRMTIITVSCGAVGEESTQLNLRRDFYVERLIGTPYVRFLERKLELGGLHSGLVVCLPWIVHFYSLSVEQSRRIYLY
ncbi:hypothetical protein B566_EDAN006844 [Ephemera danica]|nr:hypothetical protein B566_EDAN006844 [Ephemera danica]